MQYIEFEGPNRICGELELQGSKNAILPLIAACILIKQAVVLRNCPKISDVEELLELLSGYGMNYSFEDHVLWIDSSELWLKTKDGLHSTTRGSILLLGAFLGRFREAYVPYPGGCVIGKRPIDLHLSLLQAMGCTIREEPEGIYAKGVPKATHLRLDFPSVGATENVILAAVLGNGTTILEGAAKEPEVTELCLFLNACGARIWGVGTNRLMMEGVPSLHAVEWILCSDRIVAGTWMAACMATRGSLVLRNSVRTNLTGFLPVFQAMGLRVIRRHEELVLLQEKMPLAVKHLETMPFPGFPTDLQSVLVAVLTQSLGKSRITETIFESRFHILPELQRMGAVLLQEGNTVTIDGNHPLHGATVSAKELRGGAALTIAGLTAQGVTRIYGMEFIARGYEDFPETLKRIGVKSVRTEEKSNHARGR